MSTAANKEWAEEFGIRPAGQKVFFSSKAELDAADTDAPQAHILRCAFDLLKLDGILCVENVPLVYFKEVGQVRPLEIAGLHRKFWNHGGAPLLLLIAPDEVHVYSGLVRPAAQPAAGGSPSGWVETLDRASAGIREFLPAVESGEFFRRHKKSFDPARRVDRDLLDNLQATRDKILASSAGALEPRVLNALLCRLVFACYLFDREVVDQTYLESIGLRGASHLRDVLGLKPQDRAKQYLYDLFRQLGDDFNGDLFSDNLDAEAELVSPTYIDPLDDFFRATNVVSGQASFWPYDFSAIPIEAISAIYERFLKKSTDKSEGAFYTPRFLAEAVLDMALAGTESLLGRRYMDPSCGSGIFLVGLFNRMAEEWKQANPDAPNDHRARELRKLLCGNLYGVDIDPTACRITAFSLYLAYLDQLSPRGIQELRQKGYKLPKLIHYPEYAPATEVEGNIWCADFFRENDEYPVDADLVIGNPPWGSTAVKGTPAADWCADPAHQCSIPDYQMSAAFVWKAARHIDQKGRVCLILPHGTLFNHSRTALDFQRTLFKQHAVDRVLNLVDYQYFLFAEARNPAIVLTYRAGAPEGLHHSIEYWAPKSDGLVMQAEIITIPPEDRAVVKLGEVLHDLEKRDAPQIWKQRFWATARDRRLIERLSQYPRLRDHVRRPREETGDKRWLMAEGLQPVGKGDDPAKAKTLELPSKRFISATSPNLDLFLLREDCAELAEAKFTVRSGSNTATGVFRAPHVLVAQGFTSIAFADFHVSFRHALRGISGPDEDRDLLIFLAAYLRSPLAKYFLFHTSSNWGVSRQKVHVEELLRLPFLRPEAHPDPGRAREIVTEVSRVVTDASARAGEYFANREELVRAAEKSIEPLLDEYFDVLPLEKALVEDTLRVIIPSVRPTRRRAVVPTIYPSRPKQRAEYTERLCATLNGWSKSGTYTVHGVTIASEKLGVGVAILEKTLAGESAFQEPEEFGDLLATLGHLRHTTSRKLNMFELLRGAKVFDRNRLYLVKPTGQRFWTQTAALNDADEIAGSILMYVPQEVA